MELFLQHIFSAFLYIGSSEWSQSALFASSCLGRALLHQRRDIAMPKHSKKHSRASKKKREPSTSSSESSSSTCSTREKRDCKTLRRGVAISKVPFVRLQGMLARAEERLDYAWTAGMSSDMICMLLWLVTKLRPDMTTGKLGVKSYKEAQKQCRNARSREFTIMGEQRYEQMIGELLRAGQQDFEDVAYKHGFQSDWLDSAKRSKAKSSGADTSIEALERQLKAAKRRQGRAGSASASTAGGPPTPAAALAPAQGNRHGLDPDIQSLSESPPAERAMQPVADARRAVALATAVASSVASGGMSPSTGGVPPPAERQVQAAAVTALVPATAFAPAQGNRHGSDPDIQSLSELPPVEQEVQPVAEARSAVVPATALAPAQGNPQPVTPPQPVTSEPEAADAGASLSQIQLDDIAAKRARAAGKRQARAAAKSQARTSEIEVVEDGPDPSPESLASAQGPVGSETPPAREDHLCVICRGSMLVSEDRQALPCMHVFHTHCIEEYANCKGLPIDQCCPFKCNVSQSQVVMDLDPLQADAVVAEGIARSDEIEALAEVEAAARGVE